ncbi:hypothetical protein NF552_25635 (plasmid) [Roseomonas mucosa]|nr:hypothetical protein NF552_25635 [Roseomonas mucosa]
MTDRLSLAHLAFSGPDVANVGIEFRPGLNLIYGASNTGKSFAYKSIDAALGAGSPLPDIEQRRTFDRLWLAITAGGRQMTLSRALAGGPLGLWQGHITEPSPGKNSRALGQRNNASNMDNVSQFLLGEIGLRGKVIAENASGSKRPLSFRDIVRFCMVDETSIQSEASPALSGQFASAPAERRVFQLLITGNDDSAIQEVIGKGDFRVSKAAKVELVDELIAAIEVDLANDYPDAEELVAQDEKLEVNFASAQAEFDATRGSIKALLTEKRTLGQEIFQKGERLDEVEINLGRFAQLQRIYQSDIERLEAIEEAGFLLTLGGDQDCPLCGASPSAQRHVHGLDEIARVQSAATAEARKIRQQQADLEETVQQLHAEQIALRDELPALTVRLEKTERVLTELAPAMTEANRKVTEILTVRDRVKRGLSLLDQRASLQARRDALANARRERPTDKTRLEVSSTAVHEFAQTVSRVLTAWRFPGNRHVSFDEETFDLKIDGKRRRDNGKGVRAITHAAFKVALLLHCRERNLPHPGFLVLDTPLLTYRDPLTSKYGELTGDEQQIASMSLKDHFFEHLAVESQGAQFNILENIDPPANITNLAHVEVFHGNRGGGRFGLFPTA